AADAVVGGGFPVTGAFPVRVWFEEVLWDKNHDIDVNCSKVVRKINEIELAFGFVIRTQTLLVLRSVDTEPCHFSPQDQRTLCAIVPFRYICSKYLTGKVKTDTNKKSRACSRGVTSRSLIRQREQTYIQGMFNEALEKYLRAKNYVKELLFINTNGLCLVGVLLPLSTISFHPWFEYLTHSTERFAEYVAKIARE
ncbi:hypothetical protein M8C21_012600, partial [Ambrosia artemisiifolia]